MTRLQHQLQQELQQQMLQVQQELQELQEVLEQDLQMQQAQDLQVERLKAAYITSLQALSRPILRRHPDTLVRLAKSTVQTARESIKKTQDSARNMMKTADRSWRTVCTTYMGEKLCLITQTTARAVLVILKHAVQAGTCTGAISDISLVTASLASEKAESAVRRRKALIANPEECESNLGQLNATLAEMKNCRFSAWIQRRQTIVRRRIAKVQKFLNESK
ncbi:hypothetical protein BDR26DRAFT_929364 [Obelidium mucronatum]|nr:hypothetical protein BDR26DRAFT_929364 [Obelidium mucronatum]